VVVTVKPYSLELISAPKVVVANSGLLPATATIKLMTGPDIPAMEPLLNASWAGCAITDAVANQKGGKDVTFACSGLNKTTNIDFKINGAAGEGAGGGDGPGLVEPRAPALPGRRRSQRGPAPPQPLAASPPRSPSPAFPMPPPQPALTAAPCSPWPPSSTSRITT
jgi:hypothetical protein